MPQNVDLLLHVTLPPDVHLRRLDLTFGSSSEGCTGFNSKFADMHDGIGLGARGICPNSYQHGDRDIYQHRLSGSLSYHHPADSGNDGDPP